MAGMEGFPANSRGGHQDYGVYRTRSEKYSNQYIDDDPRRPSAGSRRGKMGYQKESCENSGGESDKYAGFGIGITGLLAENVISHPFIILRRQCQVHVESSRYHTNPLTLIPVMLHLNRWQGTAALFKGVGSSLTIKGLNLGLEDCISKFTPWPKEIDKHSSLKMIGQHLLLKAVSSALITPFYSVSLVESVQSDIASEKPGVLDVFKEGVMRLLHWSDPRCGRMLPVWVLIPPQVFYGVAHYIIKFITERLWLQVMKASHREYQKLKGAVSRDPDQNLPGLAHYQTQASSMVGHLVADTLLFPLETVLHRLHLQGTRSIIDNLDSGKEVIPILTRYEGVVDCFTTVVREEGVRGLFKGYGGVMLQYALHFLVIKFSSKVISQIVTVLSSNNINLPDIKSDIIGSGTGTAGGVVGGGSGTGTPGRMTPPSQTAAGTPTVPYSPKLTPGHIEESIPENAEVYGSRSSLRDSNYSATTSPRRNYDSLQQPGGGQHSYFGSSRKNWKSMETL
eukprot:TRINITY_DN5929_c0_g1_i1.p1 TRINITY_DN5929_c0_g1~~TRINITY_DN5929_c0_g1_i1.p1  ORF type:complete len:509 (+),score=82.76 TRINITY_DN5929_c0_g1_i1:82-1608(+)